MMISWNARVVIVVILHLVFLASVFDIYFSSPVVDVAVSHAPNPSFFNAPARRVIIFVADGLRADSFFQHSEEYAPYLRQIMEEQGAFGISHTRVPTESRPGHVAIMAGMYEDPSAITKGWKENPVDFDTIFNQSSRTWSWGSPDILPMFAKGVKPPTRMHMDMYEPEKEDLFGKEELHKLDTWVFERVRHFFINASESLDLRMQLREDKVILFLHLLGLDSNGHANNPDSEAYRHNIAVVDQGIRETVSIIESYWRNDDRTTFIFTSDHGMTDWGSHGTGMEHETEVPFVAWGAGIRHPLHIPLNSQVFVEKSGQLSTHRPWKVNHLYRSDLQQADIAPLVSCLLGANVPKNSVGNVPIQYLRMSNRQKIEASVAVVQQVYEMLRTLRSRFESYIHTPFYGLNDDLFNKKMADVLRLTKIDKLEKAQDAISALHKLSLDGIDYFRHYYRWHLYLMISFSYVSFITLTALNIIKRFTPWFKISQASRTGMASSILSSVLLVFMMTIFFMHNVPKHYIIYYLTPIIVVHFLLKELGQLDFIGTMSWQGFVIYGLAPTMGILIVLECIVGTFFIRAFLTPGILLLTLSQIWLCRRQSLPTQVTYLVMSIALCLASFQPSIGKERNNTLVVISGLASTLSAFVVGRCLSRAFRLSMMNFLTLLPTVSSLCVWLSACDTWTFAIVQMMSWLVFLSAIPLAIWSTVGAKLPFRLLAVVTAFQAMYTLLSLSYESLFFWCLVATMATWLHMETREAVSSDEVLFLDEAVSGEPSRDVDKWRQRRVATFHDVIRALFFLYYSVTSFFGTGNIASLNSFDPKSIRCLVSVFNPFLMGGLLLGKVLIPFMVVACFTYVVTKVCRMQEELLFLLVLLFSDIMGLHFFFAVTDNGSWQEIGTSLSHFVIAQTTVIVLQIFFALAHYLMMFPVNSKFR